MIRVFRPEDAEGVLRLTRELLPLRVETLESVLEEGRKSRCWIADLEGDIVAFGRARGRKLWLGVAPRARGRGLGAALWAQVEEHAEEPASCWSDTEAGVAFARARGFAPTRRVVVSTLDVPSSPSAEIPSPTGVELVEWSQLGELPAGLEADEHTSVPHLLPQASVAAVVDGTVAAYALVSADDRGVAENQYTFTLPRFRGRGLATLCKQAAIERARACGVRTFVAANDEANGAILAVNAKLGFRPDHVRTTLTRI